MVELVEALKGALTYTRRYRDQTFVVKMGGGILGDDRVLRNLAMQVALLESLSIRVVLVHGHGTFAIGQLLEEAHNYTATLEESCQVICLLKSLRGESAPKKGVIQQ